MDMGFFDRNRKALIEKGIDPARLPPGQYLTDRFPVLHVGDVPTYRPGEWNLSVSGLVERPFSLDLDELKKLPSVTITRDIHCVTKWSKFDTMWTGVRVHDVFERAGVKAAATHVLAHAEHGREPASPASSPRTHRRVRTKAGDRTDPAAVGLLVPHLYFWKSPKWLRGLELRADDTPGFWERNGYHMYGDPFKQQRFWGD
jgi:DMSO/TMAO reductase YedYZ molybdopterin-dependent catalytic subunit